MPHSLKLSDIVDAMQMANERVYSLFDKQTGELVIITEDELSEVRRDGDPVDPAQWQGDDLELAAAYENDPGDETSRFIPVPDRMEIDEYRIMRDFAQDQDDPIADALLDAISGAGAFRRFKDCAHRLGRIEAWYKYRDSRFAAIARDWCEDNEITLIPEPKAP